MVLVLVTLALDVFCVAVSRTEHAVWRRSW